MGLDLGVQTYTTEVTTKSWPKCHACTSRLQDMHPWRRRLLDIQLPYPVESLHVVTREAPSELKSAYRLVIRAECHGDHHQFVVEIPRRWGKTAEQIALGLVDCFIPNGKGGHKVELNKGRMRALGYRDQETSVR